MLGYVQMRIREIRHGVAYTYDYVNLIVYFLHVID